MLGKWVNISAGNILFSHFFVHPLQKDIRKARRLRKRWELRQGDPNKMNILRQKFVNQAKKYIGYPYAKKYWPPNCKYLVSETYLNSSKRLCHKY